MMKDQDGDLRGISQFFEWGSYLVIFLIEGAHARLAMSTHFGLRIDNDQAYLWMYLYPRLQVFLAFLIQTRPIERIVKAIRNMIAHGGKQIGDTRWQAAFIVFERQGEDLSLLDLLLA